MESEMAVALAADVLADHFGTAVERVGVLLMQRGALTIQDILRFSAESDVTTDTQLRFQHVRNALLTLVQHGLVVAKPHPQAAQNEALKGMLQHYSIDVEEVLDRLRFPHYLEHCHTYHSEFASELLSCAFRYGRVSAKKAIEEARAAVPGKSVHEAEEEFRKLMDAQLLRGADAYSSAPAAPSAGGPDAGASAGAPLGDGAQAAPISNGDRPQDPFSQASEAPAAAPAAKRPRVEEESGLNGVYRYNRSVLNLCVIKNLVCRLMEETANPHAGQVFAAVLTGVNPRERGERGYDVEHMQLSTVEQKMHERGSWRQGSDPTREREKIKKVLDMLSKHSHGLIKCRRVQRASSDVAPPREEGKGRSRRGSASGVSAASDQVVSEWAVDMSNVRKLLVDSATSRVIRDQFGTEGLRMFNLLNEQNPSQRLEESHIFQQCMVRPDSGREILNEMVRRSVVQWQEVPKSSNTPLVSSFWLIHVDVRRLEAAMVWNVLQSILNLRVRFRVEMHKGAPLESRLKSLSRMEKTMLKKGRQIEDILERSFLVQTAALLVFRSL